MANYPMQAFMAAQHPRVGWDLDPWQQQQVAGSVFLEGANGDPHSYTEDIDRDLAEIEMLGADIEDECEYLTVGSLRSMNRKQRRLAQKQQALENKAATARPGSRRWQRAQVALARAQAKQQRTEDRLDRKKGALASKLGIPVSSLDGMNPGVVARQEQNAAQSAAYAEAGEIGEINRSPFTGTELRIPFELAGDPVQLITIAAGPASVVPVNLQTAQITFAGFRVYGADVTVEIARGENAAGFPNQDVLPSVLVDNVTVNGDINLFYRAQSVKFGAQGGLLRQATIPGLRSNPPLQPNNTATYAGRFRQEIATVNGYSATFQSALVVRRTYDPNAVRDV